MSVRRLQLLLKALLILELLAISGIPLLRQPQDPDFFWHLKSGQWIWEHRALPGEFLFAATPPANPAAMQRFTLTSYWVMQVVMHLAHAGGGMAGVVALRFVLYALLLLALFAGKDGDDLVFLGLLVSAAVIFAQYSIERPQYASFVFFALLLALLNGLCVATAGAPLLARAAAVPALFLVWANCHGGYVAGLAIMAVWVLAESLKRLHPRLQPLPLDRYRLLLGTAAAGFLASLLNPNAYHALEVVMQPAPEVTTVVEYLSSVESYRISASPWLLVYWALLGIAAVGLVLSWRRPDLTSVALLAPTGYYSFIRVRFIPFFVVVALFVLCRLFSAPRLVRWARLAFAAAGLAVGVFFLRDVPKTFSAIARCTKVSEFHFPVGAADFIRREGLRGNMFNLYTWGGYLIWRLAPAKNFIDGRNGDRALFEAYQLILDGEGDAVVHGRPFWKILFEGRDIRYSITPIFEPLTGRVYGLLDDLLADPAWVPVFVSPTTVVFAEDGPVNHEAVRRTALPKAQFYQDLLDCCSALVSVNPAFAPAHVARGDLLLRLGDRTGARRSFEEALRVAPQHPIARERLARLRALPGVPLPP